MLTQNLSVNSITAGLRQFVTNLKSEGIDLSSDPISPAALLLDAMESAGLPENSIELVLGADELEKLGWTRNGGQLASCQFCGGQATKISTYRGMEYLTCDECADQISIHQKGKTK